MNHLIALRRLGGFVVPRGEASNSDEVVATLVAEADALGFVFSEELVAALRSLELDRLTSTSRRMLEALALSKGSHRTYRPLYPGFPEQVLAMPDVELYLNALAHYYSGGKWRPPSQQPAPHRRLLLARRRGKGKLPDRDRSEPKRVELRTRAEFEHVFTMLLAAGSSPSEADRGDIAWFVRQYRERIVGLVPETIPNRETLAVVGAELLEHVPEVAQGFIEERVTTGTDVLRLATAVSGGDVSLAAPARYVSLPRALRRTFMDKLEAAPDLVDDLGRRPEPWKRLGERLHPGDYATSHPATYDAFTAIRRGETGRTFASRVEGGLARGETERVLETLAARPGALARRLDVLLRRHPRENEVVEQFRGAADSVSTPVLLQLDAHFRHEAHRQPDPSAIRLFLPKGQTAKLWARLEHRAPLDSHLADRISDIAEDALRRRFAEREPLGSVYVDPALTDYTVPLAQRAAARSFRTVARGSRLPLPDARYVRLFLWWKNGRDRTDVDLSATLFDADFRYVDVLSYYSLKSWGGVHSGDIVDAPDGAAEFIDLDLQTLRERRVRYVSASLASFTSQPYCDLPECFAGWMARSKPGSGEIFEPRTVVDRVDLTAETTICVPLVFDLEARKTIWADMALRRHPAYENSVHANLSGLATIVKGMATFVRPDLHTLFALHADGRGRRVDSPDDADVVFSPGAGITPFDTDLIRAEFL